MGLLMNRRFSEKLTCDKKYQETRIVHWNPIANMTDRRKSAGGNGHQYPEIANEFTVQAASAAAVTAGCCGYFLPCAAFTLHHQPGKERFYVE